MKKSKIGYSFVILMFGLLLSLLCESNAQASVPSTSRMYLTNRHYLQGENIKFSFSSDAANSYTLYVSDGRTWTLLKKINTTNSSITLNDLPVGGYDAYVCSIYDATHYLDSEHVSFDVVDHATPLTAKVTADKSTSLYGTPISFSMSSDTGNYYSLFIKDIVTSNIVECITAMGFAPIETISDLPVGRYDVYSVAKYDATHTKESPHIQVEVVSSLSTPEPTKVPINPAATPEPQKSNTVVSLSAGSSFSYGSIKYMVSSVSGITGTVKVIGLKNKKSTKVVIPSVVNRAGVSFKVTAIQSKAFMNCKRIKKISIKSRYLTSIGKKAFRRIGKNTVILVPKGMVKKYSKMIRKAK